MTILYSTGCPLCKMLKNKLEEKNIPFEINSNKTDMVNKGFTSVPILEVDNVTMTCGQAVKWIEEREKRNV